MIRIKKIELELSDKTLVTIDEQKHFMPLKKISDLIVRTIFTSKLQRGTGGGSEFAQWDTAKEIGMKSTSTIYRAIKRM